MVIKSILWAITFQRRTLIDGASVLLETLYDFNLLTSTLLFFWKCYEIKISDRTF